MKARREAEKTKRREGRRKNWTRREGEEAARRWVREWETRKRK